MSNLVEQINDAFESLIATELGVTYQLMTYKFDPTKNHSRDNDKMYGVTPQGYLRVEGVVKSITLEQVFQVILTHGYVDRDSSSDKESKTFLLFDKVSEIYKAAHLTKLGIPSVVLVVQDLDVEDPEFDEDNNIVILRANFTIKYRETLD